MQTTLKLYDTDSHLTACEATVLCCGYDEAFQAYTIILDQTVFFPEGGGQLADVGFINDIEIFDVQIKEDVIVHYTTENILDKLIPGTAVTCKINWSRRFDFMQQHSAEHILSGLIHRTYGYQNVGFHLGLTETTLDFDGPLTVPQIEELETAANEAVYRNIDFHITFPDAATLASLEYRSKKELSGDVRIVTLPGYDICACCAPHVYRTGEIGTIKIVSFMTHRGGMRLTILCGKRALKDYQTKQNSVEQISALLSAKQPEVAAAVAKTKTDQQTLILRINALQKMVLDAELRSLPAPDITENVLLFQKDLDTKAIRDAVNELCTRYTGYCGIFNGDPDTGYTYVLGSSTKDCRQAATSLREAFHAKGGGSAKMIQGNVIADEKSIRTLLDI